MESNSNSNFLRKLEVLNQLIYNKNTVIDAKIGNLNELTKVLSVKEQAQEQLLVVMKALGIGKIVRNLKFEKAQRYTLTSLFISLLIMRLCGKTIAGATSNHFHGLCAVSKNTPYRALLNARIDWRMLLTKVTLRFHAILLEHQVDTDEHDTCAILDNTTFQKSGIRIEGVSKVFAHVTHNSSFYLLFSADWPNEFATALHRNWNSLATMIVWSF